MAGESTVWNDLPGFWAGFKNSLEESTKEADVQVAQQRFCIYISYQIDSLGCFSPHHQFVLYWPKQSNWCHCDTNFWATLSLAAGPPGTEPTGTKTRCHSIYVSLALQLFMCFAWTCYRHWQARVAPEWAYYPQNKINLFSGSSPFLSFMNTTLINCRVTGIIATLKIMWINLRDKFGL